MIKKLALSIVFIFTLLICFEQIKIVGVEGHSMKGKVYLAIKFFEPSKGDIVLFVHKVKNSDINIIKRIEGVSGDQIKFANNSLYINNQKVKEIKLEDTKGNHFIDQLKIENSQFFVLGDSADSFDSKFQEFGLVERKAIKSVCYQVL